MWRSAVQVCQGLHFAAWQCVTSDKFETTLGGLAQLARAPALQAGGQRFESVILHSVSHMGDSRSLTYWNRRDKEKRDSVPSGFFRARDCSGVCAPGSSGIRGQAKARKGARRMPVAREGDEGRGKLRKAAGRCKRPLIRGFPNGATRQSDGLPSAYMAEANLGN